LSFLPILLFRELPTAFFAVLSFLKSFKLMPFGNREVFSVCSRNDPIGVSAALCAPILINDNTPKSPRNGSVIVLARASRFPHCRIFHD